MSKKKTKVVKPTKGYEITEASLKDELCNYTFEITDGTGIGDEHKVKGKGIVDPDLIDAFQAFNVHLACIDDIFKHSKIEIDSISRYENHEHTSLYQVHGFKIRGTADNESIILIGTKSISCTGGRIDIVTPKIPLDKLSSYTWYNELKEAADKARKEVDLYKDGKCTPVEQIEPNDPNQLKITDGGDDDEFNNGKV